MSAAAPNLTAVLGGPLTLYLLDRHVSVSRLASFSDAEWREMGVKEILSRSFTEATCPAGLDVSQELLAVARQHTLGLLLFASVLRDAFSLHSDNAVQVVISGVGAIKKALKLLSRKVVIAARADAGGSSPDGSTGSSIARELSEIVFPRLQNQLPASMALNVVPAPECFERDRTQGHRGGRKTQRIQGLIEERRRGQSHSKEMDIQLRAVQHVSDEKQEEVLNSRHFSQLELQEKNARSQKQKRAREHDDA